MSEEFQKMRDAVAAVLKREGIEYVPVFVPQSMSRKSAEKTPSINWRITLKRKTEKAVDLTMAIDFTQGIGHIPGRSVSQSRTVDVQMDEWRAAEKGEYDPNRSSPYRKLPVPVPAPHVADILHCIVLDDPGGQSFEEWASNFGYDTDSRAAEDIYRQCVKQSRDARRLLGNAVLAELATILEDY